MNKNIDHILDTNILIRFLTHDSPKHAQRVKELFQTAPARSLTIPDVVIVEMVYVLLSVYQLTKEQIIQKIGLLLNFEKFKINTVLFQKTMEFYESHTISFVDAYVLASTFCKKNAVCYTFDKKLLAINQNKIKQP